MDQDIVSYVRQRYNLMIGERMAEEIKIAAGSAYATADDRRMTVRGRDILTGLPGEVQMTSTAVREAISGSVNAIVKAVRTETIEETPPELVADMINPGITMAGGGALLQGLDERLRHETHMPVHLAESPLTCVAVGSGSQLEEFDVIHRSSRARSRSRNGRGR